MSNNYQIYSGFVKDIDPKKYGGLNSYNWFDIWMKNTCKYAKYGSRINMFGPDPVGGGHHGNDQLAEYENLGHVGD